MTLNYYVPACIPSCMRKGEAPLYDEYLRLSCILHYSIRGLALPGKTWTHYFRSQWAMGQLLAMRQRTAK